jgi:hypothetical protein
MSEPVAKGSLLMDAQTFIEALTQGGGEDPNTQPFWIHSSGGSSVTPLPTYAHDVFLRHFAVQTGAGQTALCFVANTPEAAATIYGTPGLRPQVIAAASAINGMGMLPVTAVRIRIPANHPVWVSCDISANLYVVLSWPDIG